MSRTLEITKKIRWGTGSRSESLDARSRLLNAARDCYARLGISKTSMADIAEQAQVTRRTVYRYFSSYEDILRAVVRRETDVFWRTLHEELRGIDNFGDYVVEALLYVIRHASDTPTHDYLFNESILPIVNDTYLSDRAYLIDLAEIWRPVYERLKANSNVDQHVDLLMFSEIFNRLAISYLAAPSPVFRTEEELRELFQTTLKPFLGRPGPRETQTGSS